MQKTIKYIEQYWEFSITLVIGTIALAYAGISQNFALDSFWNFSRNLIVIWSIFVSAFLLVDMIKTLRSGKFGIDILALTAIIACILVGQFWASLVIVLMLTGGETLEDYASQRARRELSSLLKHAPQSAHLVIDQKSQTFREISIAKVQPGDIILVKPSEVVPVDGKLISDVAVFDESSLTGESLPVSRKAGGRVMSGSVNGEKLILIQATATAKDSQYEKIIELVRESEANPAPFVRLADRYAVPFTIISYTIAGVSWLISGNPLNFAEVLVVASPCPLILAAPIALISGMSRSSRHGIIVKNGAALEKFAKIRAIAFDKTGTLTSGVVEISEIEMGPEFAKNNSSAELIRLTASAENGSSHVLAESLTNFAKKENLSLAPAKNVREIAGFGIYATIESRKLIVGQREFLAKNKITNLPPEDSRTSTFIAIDGKFSGRIIFADKLRKNSHRTIARLRKLGIDKIVMLTGDNKTTASAIAANAGVDFRAELLPEDKVREIQRLCEQFGAVAMVGDGVNDAPVLAASDIGIAMGARGSTAASESADAVIVLDDISRVSTFREISQRTIRVALQSVWWGIALCIALELIAAFGLIPAIIGAALQELIDVTVILNALRAHKDFVKK